MNTIKSWFCYLYVTIIICLYMSLILLLELIKNNVKNFFYLVSCASNIFARFTSVQNCRVIYLTGDLTSYICK